MMHPFEADAGLCGPVTRVGKGRLGGRVAQVKKK